MYRYIETNNLILYIVLVKLRYYIATIAIKDKKLVGASYICLYIAIKVLKLGKAKLIYYLAIITNSNYLASI